MTRFRKPLLNLARRLYNSPAKKVLHRLPGPARDVVRAARDQLVDTADPLERIPRVYITLRCNLHCSYCSDGLAYDQSEMEYPRLTGEQWIEVIDALPGNSLIFTGGEPTLHPELPLIINSVRQPDISLYTNLACNVGKLLDSLTKPVRFFTSFHPNNLGVTVAKSVAALDLLKEHPMCREIVSHHIINHSSNGSADEIKAFSNEFSRAGYTLLRYDDQFDVNVYGADMCNFKVTKTVRCTVDRIIIAPDGKRYFCVSKMIRQTRDGAIPLETPLPSMICDEYGLCSPCDEVAQLEFNVDQQPVQIR